MASNCQKQRLKSVLYQIASKISSNQGRSEFISRGGRRPEVDGNGIRSWKSNRFGELWPDLDYGAQSNTAEKRECLAIFGIMEEVSSPSLLEDPHDKNEVYTNKLFLRAKTVYLYMASETRISRSTRAQWLVDHLGRAVTVPVIDSLDKITKPIEIVSIIPEEIGFNDWKPETTHLFQYYIHPQTKLQFLSRRYCLTYCLDMSPSLSAVDAQIGEVMMDKVFTCLKTSLEGVSKSFVLPGSTLVFHPEIYVTVIANTPFFITPAQQVLLQSWHVTSDNLSDLFKNIKAELQKLENAVAEVSQIYMDQMEERRVESNNLVGTLFEEELPRMKPFQVAMVNPDQGFINMLRFAMLALRLLPAASSAGIIVVTDGVITLPDAYLLDATLSRLRSTGVCCSFLHVGSPYHPHGGLARVPYTDLMNFVAFASCGTHMTNIPEATILDFRDLQMNTYHRAFLNWSFQSFESSFTENLNVDFTQWSLSNPSFTNIHEISLLRKWQLQESLNVPLVKLLCCRIREGYLVKNIILNETDIEIKLLLPWKYQVHLECIVKSKWPPTSTLINYSLYIKASYQFLHDISCSSRKQTSAPFREAVASRFWLTLKNHMQSDYLLVHLHSKENNPSWNIIPESVRSGLPLFYLTTGPGASASITSANEAMNSQFAAFWKPISLLDPEIWHKWLHTYRIGLILRHDYPLPKNLHLTNPNSRFQGIQCRQAATMLQAMLRDVTSFVLVDNKSFVKLFPSEGDISSGWFCIITITCKAPCVVINIAFPCGIPSKKRLALVSDLKSQLSELSCSLSSQGHFEDRQPNTDHPPVSRKCSRVSCCTVLQKPVEKILIRYKKMPSTFDTVVFPDGTQPVISAPSALTETGRAGYLVTTLSRYLHHKRWIWSAQNSLNASLGMPVVARILSTITKMRLQEGFCFAHSQAGIVNMLLEVHMQRSPELGEEVSKCVLQYVIFPPHVKPEEDRNVSEAESDEEESDGMLQIVTESWVEPHSGLVAGGPSPRTYMDQLPYNKLSDAIAKIDAQCISSLITFEHLSLMARNKSVAPPPNMSVMPDISRLKDHVIVYHEGVSICDDRIHYVPFLFNLINILPKCRQAELLFSMPIQDIPTNWQVPSKFIDNKDSLNPDLKNATLMELIFDQLSKLHDRELHLNEEDSVQFMEHLHKRERDSEVHPIPIPRHWGTNNTIPSWRCYLKGISQVHITLTFIPASYSELKSLMSHTLSNGEDSKSLKTLLLDENSISESFGSSRRLQSTQNLPEMDKALCQSTPVRKGKGSSGEKSDGLVSSFLSFDHEAAKDFQPGSYLSSGALTADRRSVSIAENSLPQFAPLEPTDSSFHRVFSAMAKPFRDRASSLDTNFGRKRRSILGLNVRTTSMEAKIWGSRSGNQSSMVSDMSGVSRSNTQASEISRDHVDKSSTADANSEEIAPNYSEQESQDTNKVFSTIPLPIFIYDCPLENLIDSLVYKDHRLIPTT